MVMSKYLTVPSDLSNGCQFQVEEWAEYYRSQGSSEEEMAAWLQQTAENPDPPPEGTAVGGWEQPIDAQAEQGLPEDAEQAEGDTTLLQQGDADSTQALATTAGGKQDPDVLSLRPFADLEDVPQPDVGSHKAISEALATQDSTGSPSPAPVPEAALQKENGGPMSEAEASAMREVSPIRDYVEAQRASDPTFGKLTRACLCHRFM